jgi:hypothetical protein
MEWTASDYSALGFICGLVIVDIFVILRAYIRARKEDKRRMVKYYCDLCGQEIADCLPYGRRYRRFMIKELRWNESGNRKEWQEIIAHNDCITKLLKQSEETNNAD